MVDEQNNKAPWLTVIGMGCDGLDSLSARAKRALDTAEVLVSSSRLFAMIPVDDRLRIEWESPLRKSLPTLIAHQGKPVAVIATGDPLHYGVANWLLTKFSIDDMQIIPGVSSFALACARLGWAQQKVKLVTLHGREDAIIRSAVAPGQNIIVLSEDATTPLKAAQHMSDMGYGGSTLTVFTHMDGVKEKRFDTIANEAASVLGAGFSDNGDHDLNVFGIHCVADTQTHPLSRAAGLPDTAFAPFGKMTKRELRALAIAKLEPQPGDVLWDVGAGSGSVSVEFLRLAPSGISHMFDKDAAAIEMQRHNADAFGISNRMISHHMPMPLNGDLNQPPRPNALFLGGGISSETIATASQVLQPGGRLVVHAVTIESEALLMAAFANHGGDLTRITLSRSSEIKGSGAKPRETVFHGFKPAMTVTQWCWRKECQA